MTITSAPARRIEVSVSSTAARSSIQPLLGGGLQHRVLAGDVVGGERGAGRVLDPADDVEVRDGGLDHQHVGALVEVELGLAHRLGGVGRIHLVAAAVAELGRRLGGVAERAVEGGGVLGAVGDDRHAGVALLVELVADRADPAVHHVAGRDHVGAGLGVGDRGLGEQLDRDVVVDLAVADEAAVAVRGVLAEADVGDHGQVRVGLLQRPDGHLDDALVVVGARARLVLVGGDAEEQDRADAGGGDLGRLGDQLGDREALDAGHRVDVLADALAGDDEQRLDQVRGRQVGLADQVAQRLGAPQAAQACGGERHSTAEFRGGREVPPSQTPGLRRSECLGWGHLSPFLKRGLTIRFLATDSFRRHGCGDWDGGNRA